VASSLNHIASSFVLHENFMPSSTLACFSSSFLPFHFSSCFLFYSSSFVKFPGQCMCLHYHSSYLLGHFPLYLLLLLVFSIFIFKTFYFSFHCIFLVFFFLIVITFTCIFLMGFFHLNISSGTPWFSI